MKITHDGYDGLTFDADGIDPSTWNGWTVPYWRTPEGVVDVVQRMIESDPNGTLEGVGIVPLRHGQAPAVAIVCEGDSEIVLRDSDGCYRLHGWTFSA